MSSVSLPSNVKREFKLRVLQKDWQGKVITDPKKVPEALGWLGDADLYALDVETYSHDHPRGGLDYLTGHIRLMQIAAKGKVVVFDMLDVGAHPEIRQFLRTRKFVGHNSIFDLTFITKTFAPDPTRGFPMWFDCTMLLATLLHHSAYPDDSTYGGNSLGNLSKRYLNFVANKEVQNTNWGGALLYQQIVYAAIDPILTLELWEKLLPAVTKRRMNRVYELKRQVMHPIVQMNFTGVPFDSTAHQKLYRRWALDMSRTSDELVALLGTFPSPSAYRKYLEANLTPEELKEWPKTESGKGLSTSEETLLASTVPMAAPLIQYTKAKKLCGTYGEGFQQSFIHPKTGRLHASYRIDGARTGRFSCYSPNLQNQPNDHEFRSLFTPDKKGDVFMVADFSQIEVRVAGEVSGDKVILDAYRNGEDIYLRTMANILGRPYESFTKASPERKLGKVLVLGLLYGLGANGMVRYAANAGVSITTNESHRYVEMYRERVAPGYYEWQCAQAQNGEQSLISKTVLGKIRKLDPTNTYGPSMNTPIQGSAAEIMSLAMVRVWKEIYSQKLSTRIVAMVHDEIVCVGPQDEADIVRGILNREMTAAYLEVFPKGVTRDLVNIYVGDSWDAKE